MSRENDIQWAIYQQLVKVNAKLDRIISGEAAIEEDVEELQPTPSAVSATLVIVSN